MNDGRAKALACGCIGCLVSGDYYSAIAQRRHHEMQMQKMRSDVAAMTRWHLFVEEFTLWARKQGHRP